jgi:hypothetical protein
MAARRAHRAGNVIAIDRGLIERTARTFYDKVSRKIAKLDPERALETVYEPFEVMAWIGVLLDQVGGGPSRVVEVNLVRSNQGGWLGPVTGGVFQPKDPSIAVFIRKNLRVGQWLGQPDETCWMIEDTLAHEMTHARDRFSLEQYKKIAAPALASKDMRAYFNHPAEVRAYAQGVVFAVERGLVRHWRTDRDIARALRDNPEGGMELVDVLLYNYTNFTEVTRSMTAKNRARVLKAVAYAVRNTVALLRARTV